MFEFSIFLMVNSFYKTMNVRRKFQRSENLIEHDHKGLVASDRSSQKWSHYLFKIGLKCNGNN